NEVKAKDEKKTRDEGKTKDKDKTRDEGKTRNKDKTKDEEDEKRGKDERRRTRGGRREEDVGQGSRALENPKRTKIDDSQRSLTQNLQSPFAKAKSIDKVMEELGQISAIKQKIAAASRAVIVVMHKFIFEEDGDRNNRRRLREFRGFEFNDDSAEFRAKLQYAVRFSIGDLISICNVLGIAYTGNAEQLRERIVRALMDVGSLRSVRSEDDDDEMDDRNDDENDVDEINDENADADKERGSIVSIERGNNRQP
ncbi:protein DEK-like, partial [Nylanderia fulva]|uniref:protein DEK-like n=1 Tax=Nylanderia fulva TaxID=613905 RepID=UPI0010FB4877